MVNGLLSLVWILLLCFSARCLMLTIRQPVSAYARSPIYSKQALRIARTYKITAWLILTLFVFASLIQSFWQTFTQSY
jgi:hypothetical protein